MVNLCGAMVVEVWSGLPLDIWSGLQPTQELAWRGRC